MKANLARRLEEIEPQILSMTGKLEPSVYGVVDRVDKVDGELVPNCVRKWKGTIGDMAETDEEPTIFIIEKLEPLILKHKKKKCIYGGRAGTKSRMAQDVLSGEVNSQGSKVFVMRERMKSLKESIYAGIETSIKRLSFPGFLSVPSKWEIRHKTGGKFVFGGLQNVIDMKGAVQYKYFLVEEAAKTKQNTIDTLGPTLRDTQGAEEWYLWNPESSQDPMSVEFITPYQAEIDKNGYYEDEYQLIIKVDLIDNPWFEYDESLIQEYSLAKQKRDDGRMSKSRFNHIWHGDFNDDVESSIVIGEWFDACVDAHKALGFAVDDNGETYPNGGKFAALDPSDVGNDPAGYVERQGVVFTCLDEIEAPNGNRKFDIASRRAKEFGCDSFGWDGDGLGATLRDQAESNFKGMKTNVYMYKGSTSVHNPKGLFKTENSNINIKADLLNKDVFANKKAQNTVAYAERIYKTYEAVVLGKYHDPDDLISFCSKSIKPNMLQKMRAESCKLPLKPSDKITFYTKAELRKGVLLPDGSRQVIPSPNILDAAVTSLDDGGIIKFVEEVDVNSIYGQSKSIW